jgi:uncharacterized protein (TIGR00295 family)
LTTPEESRRPVPDHDECIRILTECGCDEAVIAHCEAVCRAALSIGRRCGARMSLVEAGSMLHDLGRCRTHSIRHAVEGAATASELGLPDEIVSIIERHIGAGLTKAEAVSLGLPAKDYLPETLEEKVVAQADNLVDGTKRVSVRKVVVDLARQGLDEAAKRTIELHNELSRIAGVDLDALR